MRVRELLKYIEAGDHGYQGNRDIRFRGFTLRPKRRFRGLFFLVVDSRWPKSHQEKYLGSEGRPAEKIREAISNGVTGFIIARSACDDEIIELLRDQAVFFTDDTYAFMYELSRAARRFPGRAMVTAVTGSAGKSTTCAMLEHSLNSLGVGRVLLPAGNQNLFEHVASQISRVSRYSHVISEVAISTLRKYRQEAFSVAADVSIVTSITEAHAETLSGLEDIAEKKSAVFDDPPPGGTAVINLDTPHSDLLVRRAVQAGRQLVTYGESEQATIRLVDYDAMSHRVVAAVGRERISYTIGAAGKHMAINSLAVIATLRAYRLPGWRKGVEALSSFTPLAGRGETRKLKLPSGAEITLINEAFNANPASMIASLEMVADYAVPSGGRRVAVLGDILELGALSRDAHHSLVPAVAAAQLDELYLFGDEMAALEEALVGSGVSFRRWHSLEEMAEEVFGYLLQSGDIVLAKASGGTGLKDYLKHFTAEHATD